MEAFLEPPGPHFQAFSVLSKGVAPAAIASLKGLGRRGPALALTIRRPPLAVRRACLRRRAFYASPCQATAPSLERFTHRAHSAGPLRPEVELTPSKVRKSNPCFIDVQYFFKRFGGRKWRPKWRQHWCKAEHRSLPRRSWSQVAGRCGFLRLWGAFWDSPEPRKSCSRYSAGTISANLADRAGGSNIDPILVQRRSQFRIETERRQGNAPNARTRSPSQAVTALQCPK